MKLQSDLLLTIDPGATMGWALFLGGKLIASGHCTKKAFYVWQLSPQAIRAGCVLPPLPEDVEGAHLLGEMPVFYSQGQGKRKSKPNDLIKLGIILGEYVQLYRRKVDVVEFVTAQEWKGSVDKEICHNRAIRVLDPDEQMPENHNARDAVVMGLWKLGRYRR